MTLWCSPPDTKMQCVTPFVVVTCHFYLEFYDRVGYPVFWINPTVYNDALYVEISLSVDAGVIPEQVLIYNYMYML